jgi:hypothetical protein
VSNFPVPASSSRPVLIMNSVLAGASVLVGGAAFAEVVPRPVVGICALVVASVTVGWGVYTQARVTPWQDVAARTSGVTPGEFIAGPASPVKTGAVVEVTADTGPGSPYTPDKWKG